MWFYIYLWNQVRLRLTVLTVIKWFFIQQLIGYASATLAMKQRFTHVEWANLVFFNSYNGHSTWPMTTILVCHMSSGWYIYLSVLGF